MTRPCALKIFSRATLLLVCAAGAAMVISRNSWSPFAILGGALVLWAGAVVSIFYFFRDPEPSVPGSANVFVAPAHGLVDAIEEAADVAFMGKRCQRISIFLSVFDVHVQYAPVAGKVQFLERRPGRFLSALRTQSAHFNESVLTGIECSQPVGEHVAVRQIAGVIARRIVTWLQIQDVVKKGQRLGLIQFGSRCDLYLPLSARIKVRLGDRVVGGETVVAVGPRQTGQLTDREH
jgi:phosphatidylserine decarboxylase